MGKNNSANKENIERQITNRLHRIEGQVRALERLLGQSEPEQVVVQFEAIIAAVKSNLVLYLESLGDIDPLAREKIIGQVIKKLV